MAEVMVQNVAYRATVYRTGAAILVLDPGNAEVAIAGFALVIHTVVVHTVVFCEFLSNIYIFLLRMFFSTKMMVFETDYFGVSMDAVCAP